MDNIIKGCLETLSDYSKFCIQTNHDIHTFFIDDHKYYWYINRRQVVFYPTIDANVDQFTKLISGIVGPDVREIKFSNFYEYRTILKK